MTSPAITALLVDDEPPARRKLRKFLDRDPEVRVVAEAGSGEGALETIRAHAPDLVFLDIQIGGMDGFGVLEALDPGEMPAVIFVTAFDEYAVKAFEVAALDYLLKPFDAGRFAAALARAKERLREGDGGAAAEHRVRELLARVAGSTPEARRILVKTRDRALLVKPADVGWIRAAGNYVELHVDGKSYLLRATLEGIGRRLDPEAFLRVHRSFLVNAEHIEEIRPWSHGDHVLVMRDGARIRLSRRYRDRLPADIARDL